MSFSLCLFGLVLGMRHALDPDHLAAVSTLVAERRRSSSGAVLGSLWGVGHTAALLFLASAYDADGDANTGVDGYTVRAFLFDDCVGVFERTIRLDNGSLWTN